jgi:hypothetical protein
MMIRIDREDCSSCALGWDSCPNVFDENPDDCITILVIVVAPFLLPPILLAALSAGLFHPVHRRTPRTIRDALINEPRCAGAPDHAIMIFKKTVLEAKRKLLFLTKFSFSSVAFHREADG